MAASPSLHRNSPSLRVGSELTAHSPCNAIETPLLFRLSNLFVQRLRSCPCAGPAITVPQHHFETNGDSNLADSVRRSHHRFESVNSDLGAALSGKHVACHKTQILIGVSRVEARGAGAAGMTAARLTIGRGLRGVVGPLRQTRGGQSTRKWPVLELKLYHQHVDPASIAGQRRQCGARCDRKRVQRLAPRR